MVNTAFHTSFTREALLRQVITTPRWDVVVIGGGATGLGIALEAQTRGYHTVLIEMGDFAQGTSSRSTKLVHGGVRYLAQGNWQLVREALRERARILANAPHLAHWQRFVIPAYQSWEIPYYTAGLKLYDVLAGYLGGKHTHRVAIPEMLRLFPNLQAARLRGGIAYYDGQFDDARLAIHLMQMLIHTGGVALNYCRAEDFVVEGSQLVGVVACDVHTQEKYILRAPWIINATGVFADALLQRAEAKHQVLIRPSQGIHLVTDELWLGKEAALMIPRTPDGRVLFAVPWLGKCVWGTTDTPVQNIGIEPQALPSEVNFILHTAQKYLQRPIKLADVRSVFAGLRPLVSHPDARSTKDLSRKHSITRSQRGLISVLGGKWTTYRQMGEDTIDYLERAMKKPRTKSPTRDLGLQDFTTIYAQHIVNTLPEAGALLPTKVASISRAYIRAAIHTSQARSIADILGRRTRLLFLDAAEALAVADMVSHELAVALRQTEAQRLKELAEFRALAQQYLPQPLS